MHQGSAGFGGTAIDIEIQAERLERIKDADDAADRRAHRPAGGEGRAGRPSRPLVHRRGGAGLRAGRRGRSTDVATVAPGPPDGRVRGCAMGSYTIPSVIEKTVRGERAVDIYSRLLSRPDRLHRHRDRRRRGQRGDRAAAAPGGGQSGQRDQHLPQLAGRLGHRDARRSTTRCSSSGRRSRPPASGQAASSAAVLLAAGAPGRRSVLPRARVMPPPAVRRWAGDAARPGRAGQGDRAAAGDDGGRARPAHRAVPRTVAARTPTAT